jgi:hypothetical protein
MLDKPKLEFKDAFSLDLLVSDEIYKKLEKCDAQLISNYPYIVKKFNQRGKSKDNG